MPENIIDLQDFSKSFFNSLLTLEKNTTNQSQLETIIELTSIGQSLEKNFISITDESININPATLYDSISTINELSHSAIVSYEINASFRKLSSEENQNNVELIKINSETSKVMDSIGRLITPENSRDRLLSYSKGFSELSSIVSTMKDLYCENNELNGSKSVVEIEGFFKLEKNKGILEFIKGKLESLVNRLRPVIGSLIDELMAAYNKLMNHPWVTKLLSVFNELLDRFKLSMIKKHFNFVDKVIKLAKQYNWNLQSITVQLPDVGLGSVDLGGAKIPFPNVTQPIVSVTFIP